MLTAKITGSSNRFNPLSLNPQLWLDASDSSTVLNAGGLPANADEAVATWSDKSGTARHFIQNTTTYRPLKKVAVLNGRDGLQFDGINDFMGNPTFTGVSALYVFMVLRPNLKGSYHNIYDGSHMLWLQGNNRLELNAAYVVGQNVSALGYSNEWVVVSTAAQSTSPRDRIFINGQAVASNPSTRGAMSGNIALQFFARGTGQTYSGVVGEIIVCCSPLTEAQIAQTNRYLVNKWNVEPFNPLSLAPLSFFDASNYACYAGSGSTITDLSPNANGGTIVGGVTYTTTDGGAFVFNGSTGYINMPTIASGSKLNAKSGMSWAGFIKTTSIQGTFFSYGLLGVYISDILCARTSVNLFCQVNNGADGNGQLTSSAPAGYSHIAFVFDGTQSGNANRLKIYINGALQTLTFSYTVPSTTASPATPMSRIGSYVGFPGSWFLNGSIASCTLFDRAISVDEVNKIFNWGRGRLGL